MLEELALQYVNQDEGDLRLIGYGFAVVGGVLAGLTHKSSHGLARAPYFACSALLVLLAVVLRLVWLGSFPAMAGGYLWVFVLVDVLVSIALGYGIGVIAMARSRDAYGHSRLAFLAFIPFANFWLLLTPSKVALSLNRTPTIPLLAGGLGVVTGFVLLGLSSFIGFEGERMAQDALNDSAVQEIGLDFMIQAEGLEATLQQMAAEVSSQRVDEITTLLPTTNLI